MKCPHKKIHFPDTGEKCDETARSDYDSQLSEMERGPGDVVCQEDSSLILAAEAPNFIEQADEGALERSEFHNLICRHSPASCKARIPTDVTAVGGFSRSYIFQMILFKRSIRNLADCEVISARIQGKAGKR